MRAPVLEKKVVAWPEPVLGLPKVRHHPVQADNHFIRLLDASFTGGNLFAARFFRLHGQHIQGIGPNGPETGSLLPAGHHPLQTKRKGLVPGPGINGLAPVNGLAIKPPTEAEGSPIRSARISVSGCFI